MTSPGSNSLLLAFQTRACPLVGAEVVISTSDKSPTLAAAILASALALVKYKFVEPSLISSVSWLETSLTVPVTLPVKAP